MNSFLQNEGPTHAYRREGDTWLVEIRLATLDQLFNTLDAAPFWQRDLDPEAAKFIRESVEELPNNAPVKILVHVDAADPQSTEALVAKTIHEYFSYRARINRQSLRRELQRGRVSLLIGLGFLAVCSLLATLVGSLPGLLGRILSEGFVILGWVALWRPLEILLYEWWPHVGRARHNERLAALPVEVRSPQS